jgi:hypothetical protein
LNFDEGWNNMTATPMTPNLVPMSLIEPLSPEQRDRAIAMLDEWCNVSDEEAQEQRETGQYLRKVLDDERKRIGARTLFS